MHEFCVLDICVSCTLVAQEIKSKTKKWPDSWWNGEVRSSSFLWCDELRLVLIQLDYQNCCG